MGNNHDEPILDAKLSNTILALFQGDFDHPKAPPLSSHEPTNLSLTDELYGLCLFWAKAKEVFPFWKLRRVNWDELFQECLSTLLNTGPLGLEDYYTFLQSFAATLGDGHTFVQFPACIRNKWAYPALQLDPLVTEQGVSMVVSGGELPRGSVIVEVDGTPIDEVVKLVASRTSASTPQDLAAKVADTLLRRNKGERVSLRAKLPDERIILWTGVAARTPPVKEFEIQHWQDGIVHVVLPHFQSPQISTKFHETFHDFDGITGLILDLRYNPGGNTNIGYSILARLISEPVSTYRVRIPVNAPVLDSWGMTDRFWLAPREEYDLHPNADLPRFDGPVILLTSARTYSAAEDFVIAFKSAKRGVIVGEPTGGSTGQSVYFTLPGGGVGQVVGVWELAGDEHEFVGIGIQPDVPIKPTLQDYVEGKDVGLEAALKLLRQTNGSR
ncbi:S41 family peptidase [Alicyclobacillus macrosporangiidus]|uniref:C-terminal processing protease CtpA/Prc, contains a PDZ domain n=1 Tax=Alicyclobacillus macrosporangiidus TaxID=392015 RepID=A0A1I7J899_9BACL|nr:S41 family peptidase [Alicyclobacillus macrosporangiidus]SFU81420.1 C-terminal processing protease CtpA/Prc, contains a PDZ domain [Alicyclobacillus macrosporangiidus]